MHEISLLPTEILIDVRCEHVAALAWSGICVSADVGRLPQLKARTKVKMSLMKRIREKVKKVGD